MPITGPASYLPTTEAFLNHWTSVNTALGLAGPFTLPGKTLGYGDVPVTRAILSGLYDALLEQHGVVQVHVTDTDLAREDLYEQKALVLDKLNQFNEKVRGLLPESKYARRLPAVPSFGDSRSNITVPLETARNLWLRINSDGALPNGAELVLRDGDTLTDFEGMLVALRDFYKALGKEEDDLGLEREERNDMQDVIYPILKLYRVLMPTFFPPTNALVESLPLITPTGTRTPAAVEATAGWDAAAVAAKIEWTASTDADLDHYEVRWSPGTEYHADDESTLGTVSPEAAREFQTDQGLADPGDKALYRVYVVLKTGHEAGSDTVSVTRV